MALRPDLAIGAPVQLRQNESVWVVCASGFRASMAGGLLERMGFRPVVLADGGVADVARRLPAMDATAGETTRGDR